MQFLDADNYSKLGLALIFLLFSFVFSNRGFCEVLYPRKVSFNAVNIESPFKSQLPEQRKPEPIIKRPQVRPTPEPVVSRPNIEIQGIVWGGPFPQVIINNQVLKEGDTILKPEPITILEIKPQEVAVLFKKKVFTFKP